jgi:hypothetical protein
MEYRKIPERKMQEIYKKIIVFQKVNSKAEKYNYH